MKVCLIGDFSGQQSEGMANVASALFKRLSAVTKTIRVDLAGGFRPRLWRTMRSMKPDIVHYIPGPSWASFLIMDWIRKVLPRAKSVMSATHPKVGGFGLALARRMKPDLLLVQAEHTESLFRENGFSVDFLPNGVDLERFTPLEADQIGKIRRQYGMPEEHCLVLHVGPIRANRNLRLLTRVGTLGAQSLIVGSPYAGINRRLVKFLTSSGCKVIPQFLPDIPSVYSASDVYMFPVRNPTAAVETPLSVLEAMASNLPVVSTPFGALPRMFHETGGLRFAWEDEDLLEALDDVLAGDLATPENRKLVVNYSWDKIVARLIAIYEQL